MRRAAGEMSPAAPAVLLWLDRHVRAPLEGQAVDRWVFTPAKNLYLWIAGDGKRA
jgi:hypothetical protein